jgi:hypothetical protein
MSAVKNDPQDNFELPLSAPVNVRDLGGLPVSDGSVEKQHVWRADDLTMIPLDLAQQYADAGLRATIDLRSGSERDITGAGFLPQLGIPSYHLPLTQDVEVPDWVGAAKTVEEGARAPGRWYADLVESNVDKLNEALGLISETSQIAFHCTAGKDRTGILAALLLSVLGADDQTIVDDYAATTANLPKIYVRIGPLIEHLVGQMPGKENLNMAHPMMGSVPGSMMSMLAELRTRHGQVLAPLRDAGLSEATITQLRSHLID